MSKSFIELTSISKEFNGIYALNNINWKIQASEIHCLVGENGCGKSTLIKTISGVHNPSSGIIKINGENVLPLNPIKAKKLGIQVIFQDLSLFNNLTVAENIAFNENLINSFKLINRKNYKEISQNILNLLDLNLDLDCLVADLSIAQQQIVAIARGLAVDAKLIFMDEPTASLTKSEVDNLLNIVLRLQKTGISIVFISHKLDEVVQIAQRVSIMVNGEIKGVYHAKEVNQKIIAKLMAGLDIKESIISRDLSKEKILFQVNNLSRFGEFENISFNLKRGEVLGITGLLGSGRTELALSLFGMNKIDKGQLLLDNKELVLKSNQDAINSGIAYVSEDRLKLGVILAQSIKDNINLAVMNNLSNSIGLISNNKRHNLASDWINKLNIKISNLNVAVKTLSGGNQQRIVLAKWLATNPKILILDSPTIGVDIKNKQSIYRIIQDLSNQGIGIILISDEISEVFYNCDRILQMKNGKIINEFVPKNISKNQIEKIIYN